MVAGLQVPRIAIRKQEVRNGQAHFLLFLQPPLGALVLAFGTVTADLDPPAPLPGGRDGDPRVRGKPAVCDHLLQAQTLPQA
jgi:hypothetical protein